ncbi:MAG: pyridoxamine 5'-phosphate oxidase family protein [Candidatus Bipolaricaulia bacterium]
MAHDPLQMLEEALGRAEQAEPTNPNAAALGTVDLDGRPTIRMVNVRRVESRGPVF